MRDDADQTHQHGKWSSRVHHFFTLPCLFLSHTHTVTRASTSKIMRNSPRGILFNKTQSMFGFSLVEFVLSGCRGGVERVQGRRAFAEDACGVLRLRSMWANPSVTPRFYQVTTAAMPGLPRDTQTHSWGRH